MKIRPAILDGDPVRDRPFPSRKTMGEAEAHAVADVMKTDTLSAFLGGAGPYFNGGPQVRAFEEQWASRYDFRHAVSVNSWTSGLVAAIGAVGVGPGDEVICSPYTMSASATCALFYGGIPVFADIDLQTLCLCPDSVRAAITPRTRAIVVVHLLGHPADMDAIMSIADEHNLFVIEDAAQAPGVFYRGKAVGAIGHVGGFSLNFHKHIHTGEGGMLVTQNDGLAQRLRLIRNHGENAFESDDELEPYNVIGGNYRLTELQAAIGQVQLDRLDGYLTRRAELAYHVSEKLSVLPGISCQPALPPDSGSTHGHYVFPIFFDAAHAGLSRNLFLKAVLAEFTGSFGGESVALTAGYVRPLYLARIYREQIGLGRSGFPFNLHPDADALYQPGRCPVAEEMYQSRLLLSPIVREPLSEDDLDDLVHAFEKVLEHAEEISRTCPDEAEILTPLDLAGKSTVR